jgi:hypothetical protein
MQSHAPVDVMNAAFMYAARLFNPDHESTRFHKVSGSGGMIASKGSEHPWPQRPQL